MALKGQDELALWLHRARQQQRLRRLAALQAAAQAAEAEQRWPDAVQAVQQQLAVDPLSEGLHRALIRVHYLAHDLPRAQAAFNELRALLHREFGAGPSAETLSLMQLVRTASAQPPRTVGVAGGGLGLLRPPRLVGRQRELAVMQQAVADRGPLLLLGEAGMGKSRLLAEAMQGAADGVIVKAQVGDAGVPYVTRPAGRDGCSSDSRPGRKLACWLGCCPSDTRRARAGRWRPAAAATGGAAGPGRRPCAGGGGGRSALHRSCDAGTAAIAAGARGPAAGVAVHATARRGPGGDDGLA